MAKLWLATYTHKNRTRWKNKKGNAVRISRRPRKYLLWEVPICVTHVEFLLPPAYLEDTRSETLESAAEHRTCQQLPQPNTQIQVVSVLGSDSAKAMIKMAAIRKAAARAKYPLTDPRPETVPVIRPKRTVHIRCMMHMMFAAFICAVKPTLNLSDLYCATILMHKANNIKDLRSNVLATIQRRVKIIYTPPGDADANYDRNAALIGLMDLARSHPQLKQVKTIFKTSVSFRAQPFSSMPLAQGSVRHEVRIRLYAHLLLLARRHRCWLDPWRHLVLRSWRWAVRRIRAKRIQRQRDR